MTGSTIYPRNSSSGSCSITRKADGRMTPIYFWPLLYALGKYSQAIKEFDIVLSSASANRLYEEALYWSAEAYFKGKDYKGALNRYAEEMDSYPDSTYSVFSAYSKGWCYFSMGDYDNAISSFRSFINKYPSDNLAADAKFKIAESVFMSGNPPKQGLAG
jgi:TolA-binding protein